jgi:hypothetical protein
LLKTHSISSVTPSFVWANLRFCRGNTAALIFRRPSTVNVKTA